MKKQRALTSSKQPLRCSKLILFPNQMHVPNNSRRVHLGIEIEQGRDYCKAIIPGQAGSVDKVVTVSLLPLPK